MKYSIKADFIEHGCKEKIATKVDYLLNGLIYVPGAFVFDNNAIKIYSDGFDHLEGKIDITEGNNIIVDFYFHSRNDEISHYQYKDGKTRYIVSNNSGLYIIKGKDNDGKYTVSYYDQKAKNHIKNKYGTDENGEDLLLTRPVKTFKKEGISPDYKYNIKPNEMEMYDSISSFIFSSTWINDCHSFMEGESYEPAKSKSKKIGKKNH